MARKKKHEEHENHERWLVSYADFITLLFAFFVVMYSLSSVNEGKYRVLADALSAAFRSVPRSMDPIQLGKPQRPEMVQNPIINRSASAATAASQPIALPSQPIAPVDQSPKNAGKDDGDGGGRGIREIANRLAQAMAPLIEKDLITMRRYRHWLEVEIKTNILYPSGSAVLETQALPVLGSIAGILRDYPNPINIEGFTDNVPISTVAYPSNWELSAARATSVVHLFVRQGVPADRLAAVGYGEYRPIVSNDTEEGRSKNRKVVLVVLSDASAGRLRDLSDVSDPPETEATGRATSDLQERTPTRTVDSETASATALPTPSSLPPIVTPEKSELNPRNRIITVDKKSGDVANNTAFGAPPARIPKDAAGATSSATRSARGKETSPIDPIMIAPAIPSPLTLDRGG
jgi:chemotaxis protein MotB